MGEDLGGVGVCFEHHSAEPRGLDGGDPATDILKGDLDVADLAGFAAGFGDDAVLELEWVWDRVDDGLGHDGPEVR